MRKWFIAILAVLISACTSSKPTEIRLHSLSEQAVQSRIDSLLSARMSRDSVMVRDSIYMYVKGDSVTRYVERTRYRVQLRHDTIQRFIAVGDTVVVQRTDSIRVEVPVLVEKPWHWYDRGCLWFGRLCFVSLVAGFLFFIIRRKL